MKKFFAIAFGMAFTMGAMAQTPGQKTPSDKKKVEKQLENTVAAKKDEKHEAASNLSKLKVGAAVQNRKEVRADRRSIHRKAKHLKKVHGVKHPIIHAQDAVKEKKDAENGKN